MNELIAEVQRLYLPGRAVANAEAIGAMLRGERQNSVDLVGADGNARALVIEIDSAFWVQAAALYERVQTELDLPAPALSVSGGKTYGLWFSLATGAPLAHVEAFAEGLRQRYLAEVPTTRLTLHPRALLKLVPARQEGDKWSAYIDASLGRMFVDEPWLEMAPSLQKQAELLAGQLSIKPDVFERVLSTLAPMAARPAACAADSQPRTGYTEPMGFLLAIMNNTAVDTGLRIDAAKALLPYFHKTID